MDRSDFETRAFGERVTPEPGRPLQETGSLDRNKMRASVTILRPPEEVFLFWRDFSNLPLFMKDLKRIEILSPTLSKWHVQLKSGMSITWTAELRGEIPGQMIAWQSLPEESVETSGRVTFEPATGVRGTVVRLSMDYSIPGGRLVEWATFLSGEDPETLAITNLKRLKQVLETGEYATVDGQPSGREADSSYVMSH